MLEPGIYPSEIPAQISSSDALHLRYFQPHFSVKWQGIYCSAGSSSLWVGSLGICHLFLALVLGVNICRHQALVEGAVVSVDQNSAECFYDGYPYFVFLRIMANCSISKYF